MNWFLNNRELIKNLSFNTGSSQSPTWTAICTASEITLTTDLEQQDFYVFCDAIQRSIITGAALSLETTIKLDANNAAIINLLGDIADLIEDGTVSQFNNVTVQFELLTSIASSTLTYTKYQVPCTVSISDLGGAAEDATEFGLTLAFNGKGTVISE